MHYANRTIAFTGRVPVEESDLAEQQRLIAGATAPAYYDLEITTGAADTDLSAATAAAFRVRDGHGTVTTWPADITEREAGRLRVRHLFAEGDLPAPGILTVFAVVTLPSGTVRTAARQERVFAEWDS